MSSLQNNSGTMCSSGCSTQSLPQQLLYLFPRHKQVQATASSYSAYVYMGAGGTILDLRFRLILTLEQRWHVCTWVRSDFSVKVQADANSKKYYSMCVHG